MFKIKCPCGKIKEVRSINRAKRTKYCSKECFYKYRKRPFGLKYNIIVENKGWFKKGMIPWSKGTKGIVKPNSGSIKKGEHISPDTEFKNGENIGEENHNWKGDSVGYYALHTWIKRTYGKANKCENRKNKILDFECSEKSNNYDWALIKGKKYERKRENFRMLCHSCHLKYDKSK